MSYLKRHARLAPRNSKRSRDAHARNFGERAAAIREMPCTVAKYHDDEQAGPSWHIRGLLASGVPADKLACSSDKAQAAHVDGARGMGGRNSGDRAQAPLCAHHHTQAGERGTSERDAFDELYDLSLEDEAEIVAVELDARGLS